MGVIDAQVTDRQTRALYGSDDRQRTSLPSSSAIPARRGRTDGAWRGDSKKKARSNSCVCAAAMKPVRWRSSRSSSRHRGSRTAGWFRTPSPTSECHVSFADLAEGKLEACRVHRVGNEVERRSGGARSLVHLQGASGDAPHRLQSRVRKIGRRCSPARAEPEKGLRRRAQPSTTCWRRAIRTNSIGAISRMPFRTG